MKFALEIGEIEKHLVEFQYNQLLGCLRIQVDKKPIHRSTWLLNEPNREVYQFLVGQNERRAVRIEKERNQLLGSRSRVYVDNRLTRVVDGF